MTDSKLTDNLANNSPILTNSLTDAEIIKAYEFCLKGKGCTGCVADKNSKSDEFDCKLKPQDIIDLFNRLQAEKQNLEIELKAMRGAANSYKAENKRLYIALEENQKATKFWKDKSETAKAEAYKECIQKVDGTLKRYAHLHKRADEARHSTEEYADGTPMEMVSVWEVLSLKKWEMCDYETMNTLQDNIENITKERLLTEIEKDFRLLVKELVGEDK